MYKKNITYTNCEGTTRTDAFYFNLNKAELLKMQMKVKGGFTAMVQRIIDAEDQPTIIKIFEDLVRDSYGVKTPAGGFEKNSEQIRRLGPGFMTYEDFVASDAYSELFYELATDADKASEFINGVIPANLAQQLAESNGQQTV